MEDVVTAEEGCGGTLFEATNAESSGPGSAAEKEEDILWGRPVSEGVSAAIDGHSRKRFRAVADAEEGGRSPRGSRALAPRVNK